MLTKYENGAEVEVTEVARYENGAEVEAEGVYAYKNGAEELVWSAGVPPLGIYASSGAINNGIRPCINGDTICLDGEYVGSSGAQSRIVVFVESESPPTLSIDSVLVYGDSNLSGTVRLGAFTMGYNPKSNAFTGMKDLSYVFEAPVKAGGSAEDINYQFSTERTDGYYVILCTYYTESGYDPTYFYSPIQVTVKGLRINGKKIVGNMDGIYES